jgi:hypothetical protein
MKDRIKHSTVTTSHFLTVIHEGRPPRECSQLSIGYSQGPGLNYKETDQAHPCIWIHGKEYFTGTWEELKAILQAAQPAQDTAEYIYKVGQPVCWSYGIENTYTVISRRNVGIDPVTNNNGNRYQLADAAGKLFNEIPEGEILPY